MSGETDMTSHTPGGAPRDIKFDEFHSGTSLKNASIAARKRKLAQIDEQIERRAK